MNTREIIDGLIKYMENEADVSATKDVAAIQAYATLVLAKQAVNRP